MDKEERGVMGPGEAVRMLEDRPWGYFMDAEVLDVRGGSWAMHDGCSLPSISKSSFCGTQRKPGSYRNSGRGDSIEWSHHTKGGVTEKRHGAR